MGFNYKGLEREHFYEIVELAIEKLESLVQHMEPNNPDMEHVYVHMLFTHHKMMESFFETKDTRILQEAERMQSLIHRLQQIKTNATAM